MISSGTAVSKKSSVSSSGTTKKPSYGYEPKPAAPKTPIKPVKNDSSYYVKLYSSGQASSKMKQDFLQPKSAASRSKPNKLATGAKAVYNFLIGDSINTLRDPHASKFSKAVAVADLASNIIPGGAVVKNAGKAAIKVGAKLLKEPAKKAAAKVGVS